MARRRKQIDEGLFSRMTKIQRYAGVLASVGIATGVIYGGFTFARSSVKEQFGEWPYASKNVVDIVIDRTTRDINAQQISRQVQIDILKQKCAVRCESYDRKALENLIKQWQSEQKDLDRLRGK